MFLEIQISILNAILNVFQLILIVSVGRIAVIYSKFGGEYANSVKWIHESGVMDVLSALIGRYKAPSFVKVALLIFLVTATAAGFSMTILSFIIKPVQNISPMGTLQDISTPYMSHNLPYNIENSVRYVSYGNNVTMSILSMQNSTENLDYLKGKALYNVRSSDYSITCNTMDVSLNSTSLSSSPPHGCMTIDFIFMSSMVIADWDFKVFPRADGTGSFFADGPVEKLFAEVSEFVQLKYTNVVCGFIDISNNILGLPRNGKTSLPSTIANKCWTPKGELITLVMTATRFDSTLEKLNSTVSTTFGSNDLFARVIDSIHNSNETYNATHGIFYGETRVNNTSLDVAGCMFATPFVSLMPTAMCIYLNIAVIVSMNNGLSAADAAQIGQGLTINQLYSNYITVKHLPSNTSSSILDSRGITDEVAKLFASQGFWYRVDWSKGQLIVNFDSWSISDGYMIPDWLIGLSCFILVVCAVMTIWSFTLEEKYQNSFYGTVTNKLVFSREKKFSIEPIPVDLDDGFRLNGARLVCEEPLLRPLTGNGNNTANNTWERIPAYEL